MSTVPDVDYRATSQRPSWAMLPAGVREEVASLVGSRVVAADPVVTSGFTGSYAGSVRFADGSRAFVKAGGPDMPHVVDALAREARVLRALPPGIPAPGLIAASGTLGWSVLVLDVVDGRMPGQPWTAADIDAAHDACHTLAELATPCPTELAGNSVAQDMACDEGILGVGLAMGEGRFELPPGMPAWVLRRQEDLGELVLDASNHLSGGTLSHGDVRPDNLLVDGAGKAWVVDWNWVGVGPAWVDLVGLAPMMAWQGVEVDGLIETSPLTRDADQLGIDGFLAVIAAYMMSGLDEPPPPGCTPALRRHQRLMAHMFLDFLRRRRGWEA